MKLGKLLVVAMVALFTMSFAGSVHAQWTLIGQPKFDNEGKELSRNERHTNGAIRAMNRVYYNNSRVMKSEIVVTTSKDGSQSRIEEKRDEQNRVTFLMNKFWNPKVVMVRGIQQWWSYKNASDRYGEQKNFRYNPATKGWNRF